MDDDTKTPQTQPIPQVPSLPTGAINGNTVDCVNVSEINDYPILLFESIPLCNQPFHCGPLFVNKIAAQSKSMIIAISSIKSNLILNRCIFFWFQSKFFKIQRENPHLSTWLTDVQRTTENLFAVRKKCDTQAKSRQR